MSRVFADTSLYLAMNPHDAHHGTARRASEIRIQQIITTSWVIVELLDALCQRGKRIQAGRFVSKLAAHPLTTILPPTTQQLQEGIAFYTSREDKDWSLTEYISFVVMDQLGIREALTVDKHFEQAGFKALLRSPLL